jgi:hypothetical protein
MIFIDPLRDWDQIAAASRAIFAYLEEAMKRGDKDIKTWKLAEVALEAAAAVRDAKIDTKPGAFVPGSSAGGDYI